MPTFAILGFRPHTYWTAVAAVAGTADAPAVLHRRKIVFAPGAEGFVYHRAAEGDWANAPALIADARRRQAATTMREVGALIDDLKRQGIAVRVAVTAASTAKLPEALGDILSSHSRIHAAEGSFAREVIAEACAGLKLKVRRVVEKELPALCADAFGAGVPGRLKAMGAELGPPWGEDYKLAVQAAWLHLASPAPA